MLEEDAGIMSYAVGMLAFYAFTALIDLAGLGHKGVPGRKDRPIPNSNVIDAINAMWDNKSFVKDFAKILSDEGDIDKLADLVKSLKKDKSNIPHTEWIWKQINSTDFEPQPTAKRIVQKLLNTSSYKGIVNKFKLTKEDEQYFAKLLLLTIMRPKFTEYAKVYILKTLTNLGFLSKTNRKIDGYTLSSPSGR